MDGADEPKITVEGTPNPNAAKFQLDKSIFDEHGKSYFGPPPSGDDPLAEALFQIEGVEALFMVDNFVTVTKSDAVSWPEIVDSIRQVIRQEVVRAG